jgi:predicted transposase YdaD
LGANRTYKDSVFSLLFNHPETLRELYGALEGHDLPPDLPITVNTLEDALFMERVNDLSFVFADVLVVVFEHRSTVNPNMPLRCLMYLSRLYEKIIDNRDVYKSKRLTIPRPECFVLYTGAADYPDEMRLKLSEAFADLRGLGYTGPPDLELTVRVVNINRGHNEDLVRRSKTLSGYREFIGKAREYEGEMGSLEAGVKAAVKYCVGRGILKEFLELHGSEVVNMLFTEWNWDDALAVRFEEGLEEGLEKGLEKGREEIARNALMEGLSAETIQKITGLDIETIRNITP